MSHSGGNKAKAISVKGNLVWKESNSIVRHVVMMMIWYLCHGGIKIRMIILNQAVIIMISRSTQERSRLPREPPSLSQRRRTEQTLFYATVKAVIVNCHHCSLRHRHLFSLFLWFWNHTFSRKKEFFSLGTEGRQKYILFLKSSANYPFQIVRLFWSLIASHSCFGELHKMQRAPADWLEIVNISYFPPHWNLPTFFIEIPTKNSF